MMSDPGSIIITHSVWSSNEYFYIVLGTILFNSKWTDSHYGTRGYSSAFEKLYILKPLFTVLSLNGHS